MDLVFFASKRGSDFDFLRAKPLRLRAGIPWGIIITDEHPEARSVIITDEHPKARSVELAHLIGLVVLNRARPPGTLPGSGSPLGWLYVNLD